LPGLRSSHGHDSTDTRWDQADERDHGRTLARWYCYAIGALLALAGALGFFADATFDTSASQAGDPVAGGNANDQLQGDGFLGFEVNGWHNVVHLVSGILLLLLASQRGSARLGAIAFGLVYALVTIAGLIDGNDVLGTLPVNAPDNLLHIALSLLGLMAGFASPGGGTATAGSRPRRHLSTTTTTAHRLSRATRTGASPAPGANGPRSRQGLRPSRS